MVFICLKKWKVTAANEATDNKKEKEKEKSNEIEVMIEKYINSHEMTRRVIGLGAKQCLCGQVFQAKLYNLSKKKTEEVS